MSMNQDEAPAAPRVNLSKLIAQTIGTEMERDSKIVFLGEDIGYSGGPFGCSRDLFKQFGEWRVRDTPISEIGFTGDGGRLVDERVAAPRRDHDGRFHWGVPRADL